MSKSIIHYSTGGSAPSRSSDMASNITASDKQIDSPFFEESSLPQSVHSDFFNAAAETEYEISINTRRVYRTSFGLFEQYCATHQLQSLPADPRSIISFIGHQKELLQASSGTQLSKQTLTDRKSVV